MLSSRDDETDLKVLQPIEIENKVQPPVNTSTTRVSKDSDNTSAESFGSAFLPLQAGTKITRTYTFASGLEGWVILNTDYTQWQPQVDCWWDYYQGTQCANPPYAGAIRNVADTPDAVEWFDVYLPNFVSIDTLDYIWRRPTVSFWTPWTTVFYRRSESDSWTQLYHNDWVMHPILDFSTITGTYQIRIRAGQHNQINSFLDEVNLINCIGCDDPIPPDMTFSKGECPICGNAEKQNYIGDPINTYTGNFNYETTDLSIPTLGQPLRFERSYNSLSTVTDTVVYSRPLGYGWTHNYDINLTFEDDPYGEADTVILKAPHGSRMRFTEVSTGTYEPFPGVWASLERQGSTAPYTYVITAANQTAYTFGLLTDTVAVEPVTATPVLSLTLTPHYNVAAAPGTVLTVTHILTNTGSTTDTYDLTAASAGDWVSVSPLTATLAVNEAVTVTASITAPESYGRDTVVTANITATSQTTPTLTATVVETLTLRGYRLLSSRDPQGNETQFSYNSSGYLGQVSDPTGQRTLDFDYDGQGRLITVTDHTSRTVSYGYDGNDNLVTVNDTRGFTWTYTYTSTELSSGSADHLLYEVIDPEDTVLERTSYTVVDDQPKATLQEDGAGRTVAQIDYLGGGQRQIIENGRVYTDTYNGSNLLIAQTDALGRDMDYDLDGSFNRTGTTDIRGQNTDYRRTPLGLTQAITNALNETTEFEFDDHNNLETVTEDDSTETGFVYDAANNLRQIGTVSGTIFYDYNAFGQVISMTNRRDQMTRFGYDQIGNLEIITNTLNQTTTLTYDALGRVETATNARGLVTRYEYDDGDHLRFSTENEQAGPCPANECNLTTEYQYDDAGRLTLVIDPAGRQTKQEYDAGGRLERIISNYQNGSFSNSAPDEDLVTRYEYDSFGRLQSTFETLSETAERETRITYDALNRIESVIFNYVSSGNAPDQNLTTSYAYDDDQVPSIVTVTDPTGLVTRSEYDALGRLAKRIDNYQAGACPATECNLTTRYEYDNVGNLAAMIDPGDVRTEYAYDPLHRLIEVSEDGTGLNISTGYQYDPEGNLLELSINNEPLTIYRYDELNRLDEMENALGHIWAYEYDPAGNLDQLTKPDTAVIDYEYDALNRLTTIDYPSPEVDVTFGYDQLSRRTTMTDTTGATGYGYDDLDRLTAVSRQQSAVSYGYDARGNRTGLIYPDGKEVSYSYDEADRLATVTPDWDSGSYSYEYANHRLITMTLPSGLATTYGYDSANRLIELTHRQNDDTLGRYRYDLDPVGNVNVVTETQVTLIDEVYPTANGQVVLEAENGQRTNGQSHNWLLKTSLPGYTGTSYLQTSLDIDTLVQTDEITTSPKVDYPIGFTTPGTYTVWLRGYPANAAGDSVYVGLDEQTVGVTGFAPGVWTWASESANGESANLVITATGVYTLNLWMREDGLQIDRLLLTTDTNYIPTGFGPPVTVQSAISTTITRTIVYTYDNLYRLTEADYSTGEFFDYTYDDRGNRLSQTTLAGTTVYTYDAANRLTQVDGQSYTWDNNDNLLDDGSRTFTYDSENRLTELTAGGTTTSFVYNGDGDRYAQTIGGVTTDYVLDPTGLAQVLVASSSGQDSFYLPGLAQYDTAWSYYLPDRLGSTRQLVDPTGALMLGQTFDPFGNVLEQTGPGQSVFGYTGEQTDPAGLVYLRARYYDPGVGRFLTADSVVPDPLRSQAWNRYIYVENNPIAYIDPSGHQICVMAHEHIVPIECNLEGGGPSPGGGFGGTSHIRVGIEAVGVAAAALANRFYPFPLLSPDENTQLVTLPDDIQWCFNPFPMDQVDLPFNLPGRPIDVPWWGGIPGTDVSPVELPIFLPTERTPHGEDRHSQGDRPTSQAHQDRQNPREVYFDNDSGNSVYVGPKGRTHIFTPDGYHHTSFRSDKSYRQRKVESGQWTRQ
jgi:RHS repeat-associated protein